MQHPAIFLTAIVVLCLALTACTPASVRPSATAAPVARNHGAVSGELVQARAEERYRPEPGVSYEQPAEFPDNPVPVYPASLLPRALAPVAVSVKIIVDSEGRVGEVLPLDVAAADTAPFLDSVRTALLQWKFFPLVKVVEGSARTVIQVGDVATTYDGQASRLPFSQTYRFVFSQVAGVPSVSGAGAGVVR